MDLVSPMVNPDGPGPGEANHPAERVAALRKLKAHQLRQLLLIMQLEACLRRS